MRYVLPTASTVCSYTILEKMNCYISTINSLNDTPRVSSDPVIQCCVLRCHETDSFLRTFAFRH